MIFTTWVYAIFIFTFVPIYWWLIPRRFRRQTLLAGSTLFFFYHVPYHTLIIFSETLVIFLLCILIHRYRRRPLGLFFFVTALCLGTGVLVFYKYTYLLVKTFDFALEPLFGLSRATYHPAVPLLGISFFTFQFLHYITDVWRQRIAPDSFLDFAVYIMYFPTLIAGPIERYRHFNPQTHALLKERIAPADVYLGLSRILGGIAKKMLIADTLAVFADGIFAATTQDTVGTLKMWFAVYCYAFRIYFDFVAYSDIAIGSGRLLGYEIIENFRQPYLKANISDFWRNWHISLTSWIGEYLFIPLGGSKCSLSRATVNTIVTMLVCGLWHGADYHFIAWGIYHGVGLAVRRAFHAKTKDWPEARKPLTPRLRKWISVAITFQFVCVGWVLFVLPLRESLTAFAKLFGLG